MTVPATPRRAGPYPGDGATRLFPFSFKVFDKADLAVFLAVEDGSEDRLILDSDYIVSLNSDQDATPGGTIAYPASGPDMPAGRSIAIVGALEYMQPTDLPDGGAYRAAVQENAHDRTVMLVQQLLEILGRTIRLGVNTANETGLQLPVPMPLGMLGWSADGAELVNWPPAGDAQSVLNELTAFRARLASSDGAEQIGFLQDGGGAVPRTMQDKVREIVASITDFGASVGALDNVTAFASAEASSAKQIYVPAGLWSTSSATLGKVYYGPGKVVRTGGAKQANRVVHVQAAPDFGNSALLFDGDQSLIEAEHFRIPATTQVSTVTSPYFNNTLTPHLLSVEAFAGYSGMSTKVNGNSPAGQTGLIVRSTAGIVAGQTLVVGDGTPRREVLTVNVVSSGTLLAMTTNLLYTHTAAQADLVAKGNRTHFEGYRTHMDADGGGDAYAYSARISLGAAGLASNPNQTHFSYVGTAGMFDGDATATASGVYLQCSEFNIVGSNYLGDHDIAAVGDVRSYQRNNDTGARGAVWVGNLQKSEGTKYCNAAYSVLGKWLGGIDLINADFGANQAAIKLAPNHRIYFDGTSMADEAGYNLWGANAGDTYITYSSGNSQLQFVVDGTLMASISNVALATAAGRHLTSGGHISLEQGSRVYLNGLGGNTHLTFDGTHVYLVTNGGAPKQLD